MGLHGIGFAPKSPIASLMAFIDAGYLRAEFDRIAPNQKIDFVALKQKIAENFNANCNGKYDGDLVRVYYYDAIVDSSHPKYNEQNDYLSTIKKINGYQIRLGKLTPTGKNGTGSLKQKGVDVLLATDMITKAYTNQYEFAILIAGDSDFLEVVNAVKDSGKRVFGMYFKEHIADDLYDALDTRIELNNFYNAFKIIVVPQPTDDE